MELSGGCVCENDLVSFLKQLEKYTTILFATIFNDEGFVVASTLNNDLSTQDDFYQEFAAISSGIFAMAQNMVKITNPLSVVNRIIVQGGDELEGGSFGILLLTLSQDLYLVVAYPLASNFGLLLFEIKNVMASLNQCLQKNQIT